MINSAIHKEILTKDLIPIVRNTYFEEDGIFKQDLAWCHASKMMQFFFEHVNKLFLSGLAIS